MSPTGPHHLQRAEMQSWGHHEGTALPEPNNYWECEHSSDSGYIRTELLVVIAVHTYWSNCYKAPQGKWSKAHYKTIKQMLTRWTNSHDPSSILVWIRSYSTVPQPGRNLHYPVWCPMFKNLPSLLSSTLASAFFVVSLCSSPTLSLWGTVSALKLKCKYIVQVHLSPVSGVRSHTGQ